MNPLTRVRIAIAREALEVLLLWYGAFILYLGYFNGPLDPSVLIAALSVSVVAGLLLVHVVFVCIGYPSLKRRIKEATGG